MKQFFTLLLMCCGLSLFAQVPYTANDVLIPYDGLFRPGVNPAFYNGWTDNQVADLAAGNSLFGIPGVGAKALRTAMSDDFVTQFGYDYLLPTYEHYQTLGLVDNTCIVGFPHPDHKEQTEYCAGIQSEMFEGLYEDIWDGGANGTPYNDDNLFAAYMYNVVVRYKDYIKFWEIWNEPGFDYTGNCGWREPGDPVCNWWDNIPEPCDNKLRAPIYSYVRTLRIAYDVIKTLDPDAYVVVAGVGFESFLDAALRSTDNPVDGSPTAEFPHGAGAYFDIMGFHSYPHFDGTTIYYDNNIGGLAFERHSDRAAFGIPFKQTIRQGVLGGYGYDGVTYPKKEWIITEVNIGRDVYQDFSGTYNYIGGEEVQKNYIIKAVANSIRYDIHQLHVFRLAERQYSGLAQYEFDVMGLYQRLDETEPYNQIMNIEGMAYKTASDCLFGTRWDEARTNAMNLPAGVGGGAFQKANGDYVYCIWAITTVDESEVANANYTFPASFGFGNLYVKQWDFSQTFQSGQISSANIALDATPIFLTEEEFQLPAMITLVCPADMTVFAGEGANNLVVNYDQPDVSTTCTSGLEISVTGGFSSGAAFPLGLTQVEYEATDDCGNVVICSFNVTVQAPVGGCPSTIAGFTLLGEYDDHKYFISNDIARPANAQVSAQVVGGHLASINTEGENEFIRQNVSDLVYIGLNDADTEGNLEWVNNDPLTFTNYDDCSFCVPNSDDDDYVVLQPWNGGWAFSNQFNQRLYVIELPCEGGNPVDLSLQCSDNLNLQTDPSGQPVFAFWNPPTVLSDCPDGVGNATQTSGPGNGTELLGPGSYTVTYSVSDNCGNVATCSFDIVITAPNTSVDLICVEDINLVTGGAGQTVFVSWAEPGLTGLCPDGFQAPIQTSGPANPSNLTAGNYTVFYSVSNNCGNTATCSFSITIVDPLGGDCPDDFAGFTAIGEFNGHKYYLSDDISRPTDAQAASEGNEGYLAVISSQAENDFIQQNISQMVYIGLNDVDAEGDLVWVNGDPVTYNNINPCGFCNENADDQDFVIMAPWDGSWSFSNFYNNRLYVMEVDCDGPLGSNVAINCSADLEFMADGSGMATVNFAAATGATTCPTGGLSVTQTSGIASGSAQAPGDYTIMYTATDGCGNTATCSFVVTVNPDNTGGCPDILPGHTFLGEFGGSAYFVSDDVARAEDAQLTAEGFGGYLATIGSQAENDFIKPFVSGVMYIGMHDANVEGDLEWFNGETVDYTNFNVCGFCNENAEDQDYAIIHSWDGAWSWSNFWNQRRYLMEVPCGAGLNGDIDAVNRTSGETINNAFVDEQAKKPTLDRVVPNPASDFVFAKINAQTEEVVDLQIFDARGVLVKMVNVSLFPGLVFEKIDIADLPTGLYYMTIPQGQKKHAQVKFVKQRF